MDDYVVLSDFDARTIRDALAIYLDYKDDQDLSEAFELIFKAIDEAIAERSA